jgi:hypothetical protein
MAASATETNNEVLGKIRQRTAVTPGTPNRKLENPHARLMP